MAINPKLLEFLEQDQTGRKNSAGLGTLPTNSAGPINPMAQLMADLANNKLDLETDVTANPAQRIKNNLNIQADIAKNEEKPKYDTTSPMQAVRPIVNYGLGAASGTVALGESAVDTAKGIGMAALQYAETPFAINPYGLKAPTAGVLNTKYNQFRNSAENAQNEAKVIDAYLLGKNLSAREPGKLSDRLNEKREKYDSQFDDSGFLGKTLDLVNQAAFSSGQMLPSVVAARVADVILPGSGEIAGIIPIAMTSSSSYNREAYQNMREQNAKLEAEGKQPKFSEKEMIRISGAAGLFGSLIEAGGELMLGGVEGMTQNGIAKIPFVKKLMETVTNPVVKTFWRGMISFTNEGSEEVIQGIASNAMKKFLYDDSQTVFKGNGEEYFDSFIVGGLMGFSGNIAPAVQNTVGFNAARNEVAKLVQAADAVTSKTEVADASVAIAAIKERNDTNIRAILDAENSLTLDENFNVTEEQATKKDIEDNRKGFIDILEWENERLDTILDVLADKNVSTDIIENNKIRNGNTDVNSLRTGIEQFYEGGEAQNFRNKREERITGEKGTEYGLNLRQAAEGETAEQRRTRLDENMAAIMEYEQEHRDEIRNRKRAQRLHENAEAFKKVLEGYGIKDVVVDEDNLTLYDKKTGTVHIAASTSTDKAMNIKVGHEIGHAISNADANFVNDMISFMKGRNINVDALIENAKENYIKYLQKTENITESQARQKVDNDYAKEEVICEFLGQLNARSGILDAMAKQNQSLLRRVYNRVMDLVDKYTGNTGIARRYRQLAKDIRTVLEANGMEAGEIKDTAETAAQARIENKNKTARDSGSRSRNSAVDGNTADAAGRPGDSVSQNDSYVNTKFRLEQPVEETKNLIAVHNLSVPKLLDSIELGGFPSPSIAIVKADQGHTGYGPISVIFRKNSIDPSRSSQNKVYGGDAYTPTSSNARTDYKIDNNEVKKFDRMVFAASKEYADGKLSKSSSFDGFLSGNSDMTSESPERIAMHLNNEPAVIIAYAKDKGLSLPDPVMNAEFKGRYSNEYYQKVLDKIGIETAVDMFVRSEGEDLTEEDKETLKSIFNEHNAEKLENNSVFKRKFDTEEKKKAFLNAKSANLNFYAIIRDLMNFAGSSEKGEVDTYETTKTLRNAFKESDVEEWILDKIKPAYVGKGIYNGADPYTRSGNRKSFGQTHLPYTAENIVKMMNKSNEKAEGMFGSLVNMVMAASSENFSSVEGIHKAENRLQMEDEGAYNQRKTDLQNSLNEVIDTVMEENEIEYDYDTQNDIEETIVKAAGKAKTAASIVTEFKKAGYKISSETASDLLSLFKTARNFSTGYFEAKPQRVVDLSEIASVVLPEGLNDSVYKTLDDNRIGYKTYESGNDQQRLDVINSIEDIRFRADDEYMEEVQKEANDTIVTFISFGFDNTPFEGLDEYSTVYYSKDQIDKYGRSNNPNDKKLYNKIIDGIEFFTGDRRGNLNQNGYVYAEDDIGYCIMKYDDAKKLADKKKDEYINGIVEKQKSETSVSVDSEGNKLGILQEEYFKDSKARDDDGKLKVFHHGTNDKKFFVFDPSFSDDKRSLFFSDNKDVSYEYGGTIYDVYLNIKNPYVIDAKGKEWNRIRKEDEKPSRKTRDGWFNFYDENDKNEFVNRHKDEIEFVGQEINEEVIDYDYTFTENDEFLRQKEVSKKLEEEYDKYLRDKGTDVSIKDLLENARKHSFYELYKAYKGIERYLDYYRSQEDRIVFSQFVRLCKGQIQNAVNEIDRYARKKAKIIKYQTTSDVLEDILSRTVRVIPESGKYKSINTRQLSEQAKENGYDGVIIKNVIDAWGENNKGIPSTVAIVYQANQIKEIDNINPTGDSDIRYRIEDYENVSRETEKKSKKPVNHRTGSKADIKAKSKVIRKNQKAMEDYAVTPLSEFEGKERETAIDMKLRYWDKMASMYKRQGSVAGDAEKELLMTNFQEGIFGDPNTILAQAKFMEMLSEIGNKEDKERFASFMLGASAEIQNALDKKEAAKREQKKKDLAVQRELDYERAAFEFNRDTAAPLPNAPTNEEAVIETTDEFGDAPPGFKETMEQAIAYDTAKEEERQREKQHFYSRAEQLAEQYNLDNTYDMPTRETYNGEDITPEDLEGIDIPSLEAKPTVKDKVESERIARAEIQIMDAIREYDHEKELIRKRAQAMEAKQTRKLAEGIRDKIQGAIKKLVPMAAFRNSEAVSEENKLTAEETIRRDKEQKAIRNRMKLLEKRMYDVETDTSLIKEWKYSDADHRAELENQNETVREYAGLYRRAAEIRQQKSSGKAYKNDFYRIGAELQKRLSSLGGFPTVEELDDIGAWILTELVDYTNSQKQDVQDFIHEYNSMDEKGRAKLLKTAEEKLGKTKAREVTGILNLYDQVFDATFGIDEKLQEIKEKWKNFEEDTIKNSRKLAAQKERYESYQADIDVARFHLGSDITPEQLEKIRAEIDEKRKTLDKMRIEISDADRISARRFLDDNANVEKSERETARYLRAYAVAEFILGEEEQSKLEADEAAVSRLESQYRTAKEKSDAFRKEHRKEMERYTRQGFTDDSAEIFVRRDIRMQEERELNKNSVLAKLGYKIAAPIRDDYGMSSVILESEAKAKEIGNRISEYIEYYTVSKYVVGIAKDIAAGKMTLLEVDSTPQYRDIMGKRVATGKTSKVLPSSGLTGANLDHARVLSTLYAEQNDYLEGGIKARKRAISDELSSTLDAVFSDYDFAANLKESGKLSSKVFDYLMHYSSPENIMTDVFGDNAVADYLTEQYITPVIRNAAEARRMTNRQTKRLNDLNLTKQESALTQIIAEYSNLRDITEAVNSDVDGETIINLGTLINLLQGSMSAEEFARRIARAKAGEAFDGKKMSNFAKQQTKASKEAYDEAFLHSEEVEEMHEEAEADADYNDKDAYGGEEWEGLVETLKQIQYQAKGADAKKIAEKCMKAAETCRELMNDMYDAFNEMYVTHGGQRMNFRKDYMPHQQSEDVRTKMDEIMKMMDLDPVKEIPTAIKGRTRDNRPYSKWLSFRQKRTGEKTIYDAVGNIYNYLSAANQALYHIDDIFKLRHLETYVRSIHERELQDFHQVIADHMVNADIMEGENGPKTSNTQFGRFAEWLKLYTDDLCGKQVYRDAESMYGRPHLNKWAWVQRMSNKTMLAFNLASAMKQISQVPTVMSELGVTDTIDAFMDAMNDNNVNQITYDILGRSTFLAEKEKIEEIDYREYRNRKEETGGGILNNLDKRDASIGSILKDKADTISDYLQGFDRFNSRFAVYAYFKQGMDNGMTSDEALAYADRRARQINASRLRGAQPLAFRNKGVIQGIINMYQRETVAQIENLTKYMPRQMKKFYDENGKEATAKLITKRIVQHQLITAAFNTAFYALGIGTPAMFDVLGSIIRAAWSNFKHIPGDDERDLFEKIIGAGGNLGDEIMDDLPIVSTIYELVAGDSTNRLPIYSVDLKKIAKAITNCKTLKQLHDKLENSGSELEAKMIKEMMSEETEAAGVNILLAALNLSGAFVEGGSQMRKTITALIDLAHGGRYSHGAGAGNLQYEVGARDAIPALLFGTSGLPQAKDYYAGNAGLSSTATQVYKDLLGQGMSTEKAYDLVREVSKQKNNAEKNKTLDKLKIGMEAKSSIYMGMIASDAEKRAYDLAAYGLGGIDKAVVGLTIRDIKAESLQSDKIGKLLEAGLNNQQTEDIYMQMIAHWETDENGHRVKITDTDKYLACREAGMDIKDYLTAKKSYKEIYDKDISATQKASELYRWAKQSGDYSDRQISAITENFSYYSNVKANADSYRKYEDAGIDLDTSMEIYDSMRGKTTNASKIDTLIGLNLAKDDLRNALSATLSESTWNLVKDGLDNGMNIKNYAKVIKADADGNKRLSKDERKAAIDKIPGLTDADRSVLWIATGGSAVNNPYEGTQKKQTGFGSGYGAGFGSGFGSGFGTGFGSGFGTSSNDDDPDGFLAAALNAYKK